MLSSSKGVAADQLCPGQPVPCCEHRNGLFVDRDDRSRSHFAAILDAFHYMSLPLASPDTILWFDLMDSLSMQFACVHLPSLRFCLVDFSLCLQFNFVDLSSLRFGLADLSCLWCDLADSSWLQYKLVDIIVSATQPCGFVVSVVWSCGFVISSRSFFITLPDTTQ
jgi:hypothetical protein